MTIRVNPTLGDFRFTFFAVSIVAMIGLIDSFRLDRAAAVHVSGHRR